MARVSTGGRRPRLTAAERRQRILDAADGLFGAEDYRAVTVGRVSDAAGITTPVFYDHFASKQALYEELLLAHAQRLVAATTVVTDDTTLAETLHANVAAFFAFVEAHPGAWRMLFRDAPAEPGIEALHAAIQEAATARLAATIVARAHGVRLSVEVPPDQASIMLAELGKSALNGLAGWWWSHRHVDRETVTAVAYDLLWNGITGITGDDARSRGTTAPSPARTSP